MAACPTNAIENGGAGSIAEQLVRPAPDVMLGGGKALLRPDRQGRPVRRADRPAAGAGRGLPGRHRRRRAGRGQRATSRSSGAFAPNNMDLEWVGPTPTPTGTAPSTLHGRTPRAPASQPHLVDMAEQGASRSLDQQTRASRKGFFLQIEGASIDKQDHAANPCGQIGETVEFDAAVKLALRLPADAPGHARRRHRRPRPHQPDRRGRHDHDRRHRDADAPHDGADMTISYATTPYPRLAAAHRHRGADRRRRVRRRANVLGRDQPDRPLLHDAAGPRALSAVLAGWAVIRPPRRARHAGVSINATVALAAIAKGRVVGGGRRTRRSWPARPPNRHRTRSRPASTLSGGCGRGTDSKRGGE